jgi:RNA polymerase sigma-70 factor (ECF subfamily)
MLDDEILAALDGLPAEHRLVVTLCDIEGLSYREIAETIERPVGTVMSRLHRARKQLQSALHDVAVERGLVAGESQGRQVVQLDGYRKSGAGQ